jgi:hypothetical protein
LNPTPPCAATRALLIVTIVLPLQACGGSRAGPAADAGADTLLGTDAAGDAGGDGDAGLVPLACGHFVDVNACEADASCPAELEVMLGLTAVGTATDSRVRAPESVAFLPDERRAIVASGYDRAVGELQFDDRELRFTRVATVPATSQWQALTKVAVHPTGAFAAVALSDADCAPGEVVFLDVGESFGAVLRRIEVGFQPDSLAFSPDGAFLVTADEDQDRPCKPADRLGGTVTIIALGAGPAEAQVVDTLVVDHAANAEPEAVAVGSAGTIAVTLQDSSEVLLASLEEVPGAAHAVVALEAGSEPEGVAVDDPRGLVVVTLEAADGIASIDIASREILHVYEIRGSGDVPDTYSRGSGPTCVHEPEDLVLVRHQGATFAVFPLQESHALMAYAVGDDGNFRFDSIAPSGTGWITGDGRLVRPEGVAADARAGLFLTANERERSVTLFRSAATAFVEEPCPP